MESDLRLCAACRNGILGFQRLAGSLGQGGYLLYCCIETVAPLNGTESK